MLPLAGGPLAVPLSRQVLQAYGISFVASVVADTPDAAVDWAREHGFPMVMKIASPDIAHRSDIGGVMLDVRDEAALRLAWDTILRNVAQHCPTARIEGIEMQRQVSRQIEAFVGHVHDQNLGAAVGLGLGGVLVELLDDARRAIAPLSTDEALAMIGATRLGKIMAGYRSLNPITASDGLADLAMRLSFLAHDLGDILSESDLNPVLIEPGTGHATLVDALLVARPRPDPAAVQVG